MSETDLERLSRLMLGEFSRVHDRFDAVHDRFDRIDSRLDGIEAELKDIHRRLDSLGEAAGNFAGFAKEIDHLLARVAAIEKHLGLQSTSRRSLM